jgi:hypothetical protein
MEPSRKYSIYSRPIANIAHTNRERGEVVVRLVVRPAVVVWWGSCMHVIARQRVYKDAYIRK